MRLLVSQAGALVRCGMCADTGFMPVKRARLYTNPKRRDCDLKPFIIYVLCRYCDIWRPHAAHRDVDGVVAAD